MKLSLIIRNGEPLPGRQPSASRSGRIWDVDPAVLSLVTGVLLGREDIESILRDVGVDWTGGREDALRVRLLVGCTKRCALAEHVERVLDESTQEFHELVESRPMMELADRWSRDRRLMSGEQIAALLWRLATDPRPHLERLTSRVSGELCVRAMRLLREERRVPTGGWEDDDPRSAFELSPEASVQSARVEAAPAAVARASEATRRRGSASPRCARRSDMEHGAITHAKTGSGCRLICVGCGDMVRFDGGALDTVRTDLERRTGFTVVAHEFEVFGRCPSCRRSRPCGTAAPRGDA